MNSHDEGYGYADMQEETRLMNGKVRINDCRWMSSVVRVTVGAAFLIGACHVATAQESVSVSGSANAFGASTNQYSFGTLAASSSANAPTFFSVTSYEPYAQAVTPFAATTVTLPGGASVSFTPSGTFSAESSSGVKESFPAASAPSSTLASEPNVASFSGFTGQGTLYYEASLLGSDSIGGTETGSISFGGSTSGTAHHFKPLDGGTPEPGQWSMLAGCVTAAGISVMRRRRRRNA